MKYAFSSLITATVVPPIVKKTNWDIAKVVSIAQSKS